MEPQKPRRRWFRFRLRTLLIMVTLLSVPLGWVGWELDQRRKEKIAIAWVEKMGEQVYFKLDSNDEISWWDKTEDKWFGDRVRGVGFSGPLLSDLSPLAELKNLEALDLNGTQVSDLSPLAELKNLKFLFLADMQVSDLSPLAELKNLRSLALRWTPVSDLSPLAELRNLRSLDLHGTPVNEEQLEELRLALPNCKIRH